MSPIVLQTQGYCTKLLKYLTKVLLWSNDADINDQKWLYKFLETKFLETVANSGIVSCLGENLFISDWHQRKKVFIWLVKRGKTRFLSWILDWPHSLEADKDIQRDFGSLRHLKPSCPLFRTFLVKHQKIVTFDYD